MLDQRRPQAERGLQQLFSKSGIFSGLLVAALVVGAQRLISGLPDREAQPDRVAAVTFTPVRLPPVRLATSEPTLRIAGAWRVTSSEPRFGGLSALAVDRGALLALTDSGVVVRMPRPGGATSMATFRDLPDGPGDPRRKSRRDSEALARLADGDWLVAFENRNQLWRYDPAFRSGRRVVAFTNQGWPTNRGIEAMTIDREGGVLLIPEGRGTLIALGNRGEYHSLANDGWTVSDAARLPDGRQYLLLRRITIWGVRNAIGELEPNAAGWRIAVRARLPIGVLDNAEGMAAEPIPGGGTRLWIVTDNDFAGYRRTLLLALELVMPNPSSPDLSARRRAT